ncbi:MAG: hypothetical protein H3Z54_09560 [archaeon]|nr:hypothetical protein [archaeon]
MSLPDDVLKKWREDVDKAYSIYSSRSSNPEYEQLIIADYLLERAYAHDPLVMNWLDAHGYAIEDLEAEIERLERALARRRVGAKIIDVFKMREDIAEKERHLTRLLELELILDGVQRMERWAMDKMKEKGFATVEELEAEVDRLRGIVGDPQEIEPLILKDHIETNIVRVADYIQTEGVITVTHYTKDRVWAPIVSVGMGVEEPIEYTGRLLEAYIRHRKRDEAWSWTVAWSEALSLLKTVEPYLMADKWESARYLLNIGKVMPDTEYRPMYHGVVKRKIRPVFLYPEYVDFPVKYAVIVKKGDELPRPLRLLPLPIKYTPDGVAIRWHEGMVRDL